MMNPNRLALILALVHLGAIPQAALADCDPGETRVEESRPQPPSSDGPSNTLVNMAVRYGTTTQCWLFLPLARESRGKAMMTANRRPMILDKA